MVKIKITHNTVQCAH